MTDRTEEAWRLLHTPVGARGSGRIRYGAAMALYQAGALSVAELEVYRAASARVSRDPAHLLVAGRVPLTEPPARDGPAAITNLVVEADRYIATLPGDGPVEVRQGMARWSAGPVAPLHARAHPVVAAHLPAALADLAPTHPALAAALAAASRLLAWAPYDRYPRDQIGNAFADGHAFASIMGDGAPLPACDFELGLFLIAPHLLYRDHCHTAPELYAPLTGPHGWRFGPGRPLIVKPAHVPVWNPSYRPHLTKVGPVPFLCIFGWTRDVNDPARVIPADDWPRLEALRLG